MAERIWQQNYVEGIPDEIDISGCRSIVQMFNDTVRKYADHVAFSNFGAELTYGDVDRLSRDFAAYLQNGLGLKKGGRVAMMAPNTLAFAVGMFGVIRAGGVQVNVNPLYSAHELEHQLNDSDVDTIIIFSGSTAALAAIIDKTPIRNVIVFGLDDMVNRGLPSPPVDARLQNTIAFTDALATGSSQEFNEPDLDHDDLLFLQYTGGTTGDPKGAMLSHRNGSHNILSITRWLAWDMGKGVLLSGFPFFHIAG